MARWLVAVPSAALVTFVLFFGMQALIAMGDKEMKPAISGKIVGFVRLKRDEAPIPEEQAMPERPPPVDAPPSSDMTPDAPTGEIGAQTLEIAAPTVSTSVDLQMGQAIGTAVGDTDAVPLVRVNPVYPPALRRDGVEGWVRVRFSIDKQGRTKNVSVIDSKPAVVFDQAVLEAVRKWKYQPKVVDGVAVERHGLTIKLTLKLDKE